MNMTDSKIIFDKDGVCDYCNSCRLLKWDITSWKPDENNEIKLGKILSNIRE